MNYLKQGYYCPVTQPFAIIFIDDLNLATQEESEIYKKHKSPSGLIRSLSASGGWYSNENNQFNTILNTNFLCTYTKDVLSSHSPKKEWNITDRTLRHFIFITLDQLSESDIKHIFREHVQLGTAHNFIKRHNLEICNELATQYFPMRRKLARISRVYSINITIQKIIHLISTVSHTSLTPRKKGKEKETIIQLWGAEFARIFLKQIYSPEYKAGMTARKTEHDTRMVSIEEQEEESDESDLRFVGSDSSEGERKNSDAAGESDSNNPEESSSSGSSGSGSSHEESRSENEESEEEIFQLKPLKTAWNEAKELLIEMFHRVALKIGVVNGSQLLNKIRPHILFNVKLLSSKNNIFQESSNSESDSENKAKKMNENIKGKRLNIKLVNKIREYKYQFFKKNRRDEFMHVNIYFIYIYIYSL